MSNGFHLGPRLELRRELRQELRLEQKLKLELSLKRPHMSWVEPKPLKPIEKDKRGRFVRISERELFSYAKGMRRLRRVIEHELPSAVIVSLRGGYTPVMSIKDLVRVSKNLAETPAYALYTPRYVNMKTSYFLKNLSDVVATDLAKALTRIKGQHGRTKKLMFVDTSVTGTKLGWFLPQFVSAVRTGMELAGIKQLQLVTVVIEHNAPGVFKSEIVSSDQSFSHKQVTIGVKNLICEDNPSLLGVKLSRKKDQVHEEAEGTVNAYEKAVPHDIVIQHNDGREEYVKRKKGESSFDLLLSLVRQAMKK